MTKKFELACARRVGLYSTGPRGGGEVRACGIECENYSGFRLAAVDGIRRPGADLIVMPEECRLRARAARAFTCNFSAAPTGLDVDFFEDGFNDESYTMDTVWLRRDAWCDGHGQRGDSKATCTD